MPLAVIVVTGIALIPGYLNIQLISAILIDRPRPLNFDGAFPAITLMVAANNEELAIAETLDYVLRSDYPGEFEVVADDGRRIGHGTSWPTTSSVTRRCA